MSHTLRMRFVMMGAVLALLTACGGADTSATTSTPPTTTTTATDEDAGNTGSVEPPPTAPNVDLAALPEWFVDEDAAPDDLIEVIGSELNAGYVGSMAVEWPTGGLGCSDGGYDLQAVTPGFVIFYEGIDGLIRVHASESGNWKECDLGRPLEGVPTVTS